MENTDVLIIGSGPVGAIAALTGKSNYPDKDFLSFYEYPASCCDWELYNIMFLKILNEISFQNGKPHLATIMVKRNRARIKVLCLFYKLYGQIHSP